MPNFIKKIFILIGQLPLIGCLWLWRDQIKSAPIRTITVVLAYETGLAVVAFIRDVWGNIRNRAIQYISDWLWASIIHFAPGSFRRYRKYIINEHGIFNVRGLGLINTYTLLLNQVFVDLRVDPTNPQKFNLDPIAQRRFQSNRPIWEFLETHESEEFSAVGLAIIGPPGCGKSTLLQHVAVTLAANQQIHFRVRSYIPLLLFLRDHADTICRDEPALAQLAQQYFADQKLFPTLRLSPKWFERQLKKGKCLVLLDGIDEVGDFEKRKAVAEWIDNQIRIYPNCRFVVTSRPQGYRSTPLQRAHILEVQPFNNSQVRKFIKNWYLANEIISSGNKSNQEVVRRADKDAHDLLQRLYDSPALNDLTVNPLLLTMIAMVHRYHGALPGGRSELYSEICEVLLGRWRQTKGIDEKFKTTQKLLVLRPLASNMMDRKLRDIKKEEAISVIRWPLERIGIKHGQTEAFLVELQATSGLLLEREPGFWSFAHQTFQEYLTAAHWIDQKNLAPDYPKFVNDSWWQETLRLYAAQSDATPILQACIDINSVETLSLASDCLEEARDLDPTARAVVEDRVISALESDEMARRHLAANVHLSRRLKSLKHIDDNREIDLHFLTCAEYQLFIDEMINQGKYRQPDHWISAKFRKGEALLPIRGIRAEDAVAFCEWLTQQHGGRFHYRLPTLQESQQHPAPNNEIAAWCTNDSEFALVGIKESEEREIMLKVKELSSLPELSFQDLSRTRTHASEDILALSLACALDIYRTRSYIKSKSINLNKSSDINDLFFSIPSPGVYGLSIKLATDLSRYLELTLNRSLNQEYHSDSDRTHELSIARELAFDHDLSLSFYSYFWRFSADETSVAAVIYQREFDKAEKLLTESLDKLSSIHSRRATIIRDLLCIYTAKTDSEINETRNQYINHLLEYATEGFQEILLRRTKKVYKPSHQLLGLHWWRQIVRERKEGRLSAWESIRIVREQIIKT